jgi:hypothetical protein
MMKLITILTMKEKRPFLLTKEAVTASQLLKV